MINSFKHTKEILQDAPKYSTNREEFKQLVEDSNDSAAHELLSLKDILVNNPPKVNGGRIEKYRMRSLKSKSNPDQESEVIKIVHVSRHPVRFKKQISYLVIMKDMTIQKSLREERTKTKRWKRLASCVQHEMVTTLGYNIDLTEILLEKLKQRIYRPQLKLLLVVNKTALISAQDMMD